MAGDALRSASRAMGCSSGNGSTVVDSPPGALPRSQRPTMPAGTERGVRGAAPERDGIRRLVRGVRQAAAAGARRVRARPAGGAER